MPLPFALGAMGANILDYALGRPMNLWGKQIDAQQGPTVRTSSHNANLRRPNVIPPADALFEAFRRGLIGWRTAQRFLSMQGVPFDMRPLVIGGRESLWTPSAATGQDGQFTQDLSELWEQIAKMRRSRPDASTPANLAARKRITPDQWTSLVGGLDWDSDLYNIAANASYESPGLQDLLQLLRLGKITPAQYQLWAARLGWFNRDARLLAAQVSNLPTPPELYVSMYRGAINRDQLKRYLYALGYTDDTALSIMDSSMRPAPGPSDLVRFAVREVWDQQTVQRWGYDDEFPPEFQAWMDWQGMGWGESLTAPNGQRLPNVPWPLAFWRAHWQIMSPQQAYRALHLLRPDRLHRYQAISPGVQEFNVQDMATVLKVSDYPPKMRAWLQAIAFQPLRLVDIRSGFQNGIRDRAWAVNQLLDRGLVREDADFSVDLWAARQQIAERQAREAIQRSIYVETVKEVRAAYRMGGFDTQTATARLTMLGFTLPQVNRVLALEDAKGARQRLEVFLRQMRRSYLSGALSDQEVATSLQAAQIGQQAIAHYLRLWQSELGIERRSLSTAQIVQSVANGLLDQSTAEARLSRLGWTAPDIALQLQGAVAKLTRAQAKAAQQAANTAARQGKALLAAQRQAAQTLRSAQSRLRRIYPLGTLKRQFCLGIRKAPTISALLASQGYTQDSIDGLLKQWVIECEESPPAAEKVAAVGTAYARRQTPLSTIKQWWQNGIVTDKWARARLAAIGVEPSAIPATISLWQSTLGKKSGPATQATAQTQPTL